jgi:hypothetical protein
MLQASKEQQEHITEIIDNSFVYGTEEPHGYANDTDITLWIPYDGGYDSVCVDISFDMMAEIVDYLREQNNKI